ncbi:ribosome maturation factor RimM [Rikenella microfusus]|uniref:ribosome maturation factor RimM n=1 Tax=Rikenella microfusus TaxID=28139 RepID=UPI001D592861|nr:16S rRNA processing protein RimM [Rikenella microfusus]HJE88983.1 16S rRNA processing protein RimM [Rikenella microfusus]
MGKRQSLAYADRAAAVIAEPANAVGRIRKTYGGGADDSKNGALLATLYDTFPESFDTAEPLWVEIDSLAVPLFIASLERRGAASAVVSFDDFGRAEEAELLVGKVLYAERDNVRDEEGTDFEILIGYELTDRTTGRRGTVTAFYDYPGNPLLEVDFDGREVMVPAADGLVEVASVRRKRLEADLPEGLFDL